MEILIGSSEVQPFSKTGGLADVVSALCKYLSEKGVNVNLVTPLYQGLKDHPHIHKSDQVLDIMLGNKMHQAQLYEYEVSSNLKIYFVDHIHFFDRNGIYGEQNEDYADNAERFLFLTKVMLQLIIDLSHRPDVVHIHDWHLAMFPALLKKAVTDKRIADPPKTLLTIHNLAYQGLFSSSQFFLTNLDGSFFTPSGVEFFGKMNFLKSGIVFSDHVNTVSPSYSNEILMPQFGCGLEGVLHEKKERLSGILNGVDYEEWNTKSNVHLHFPYSIDDMKGKAFEKKRLQEYFNLSTEGGALFGMISRLVEQKGVSILLEALRQALNHNMQFILLGSGETHLEEALHEIEKAFPKKVRVKLGYDVGLSHRIEAACDFFMMPSRFEPCGLNQLYSLRYGTIPIVHNVGGLKDSVIDKSENVDKATGIKLMGFTSASVLEGIYQGIKMYEKPDLMRAYQRRGMMADFSWKQTSQAYLDLYRSMIRSSMIRL